MFPEVCGLYFIALSEVQEMSGSERLVSDCEESSFCSVGQCLMHTIALRQVEVFQSVKLNSWQSHLVVGSIL